MSLLDFLASILSNIITVFQTLWNNVYFIISTAYGSIYNYWQRLQYYLNGYANTYVYDSDWYHNFARPKTDYLSVFNFDKTKYTTIDTFYPQVEYNQNLRSPLSTFVYTLQDRVVNFFNNAYYKLMQIAAYPAEVINYAFGQGASVVRTYEQYGKATVEFLTPRKDRLGDVTEAGFFGKLVQVVGPLFNPMSTVAVSWFSKLGSLIARFLEIMGLTDTPLYARIHSIFTTSYTGLLGLLDIGGKILDLFSPTKQTRLEYLISRGFDILHSLTEEPDKTLLGMIRDVFLGWFGDLLFEWLFKPNEDF